MRPSCASTAPGTTSITSGVSWPSFRRSSTPSAARRTLPANGPVDPRQRRPGRQPLFDPWSGIIAVEETAMASRTAVEPNPEEAAELEAAIAPMIAEMDELRALMERDQVEIDRLKAETEQIKAETNVLKEKSRAVQADTRSLL